MTTHVERSIEVEVPVRTAYDQWSRFEEFPRFMSGVEEVRQVGDAHDALGRARSPECAASGTLRSSSRCRTRRSPGRRRPGRRTPGRCSSTAVATDCTRVRLTLDFEPEGVVERIGDVLDVVQRQAVADLDRFKEFIEGQGSAAGGWRGTSEDGGVMSQEAQGQAIRQGATDEPGDVVAVGPTGDTESTLTTDPEPAPRARRRPTTRRSGTAATLSPWTRRRSARTATGTDEAWASGRQRSRRGPWRARHQRRGRRGAGLRGRGPRRRRTSSPGTSRTGTSPVRVSWSGTSRTGTSPSAISRTAGSARRAPVRRSRSRPQPDRRERPIHRSGARVLRHRIRARDPAAADTGDGVPRRRKCVSALRHRWVGAVAAVILGGVVDGVVRERTRRTRPHRRPSRPWWGLPCNRPPIVAGRWSTPVQGAPASPRARSAA